MHLDDFGGHLSDRGHGSDRPILSQRLLPECLDRLPLFDDFESLLGNLVLCRSFLRRGHPRRSLLARRLCLLL